MDRKKLLFVYNSHAGKARIKNYLVGMIDLFTKEGYEVTCCPTQKQGDAVGIVAERLKEFDLLVCSGGDGTLDEVVTGLIRSGKRVPLGYIPAGSTNDFAGSLGIPKQMMKAAEVIMQKKEFVCDIGRMNGDIFVYVAAFGLFTEVSYETNQQMKNLMGHMAYILEGTKRLSDIHSYHMKVFADDRELEGDYLYGMVTNSHSVGGFKHLTGKNVSLNDGLFEVMLVEMPRNPLDLSKLVTSLMSGKFDSDECIHCFKSAHIRFESEMEISWTRDGEFGGAHKCAELYNEKGAVTFLVP